MLRSRVAAIARRIPQVRKFYHDDIRRRSKEIDRLFLSASKSIVHVGANLGQERFLYEAFGVKVLWIEALQNVFVALEKNLRGFQNQVAVKALVSDKQDQTVEFRVASNFGASSSMFGFAAHQEMWPDVEMQRSLSITTRTLDDLIDPDQDVDAIVLDVQGAELKVLQGVQDRLQSIRFIKAEAADFNAYQGGCNEAEIALFLGRHGFTERARDVFAEKIGLGRYSDILFEKI